MPACEERVASLSMRKHKWWHWVRQSTRASQAQQALRRRSAALVGSAASSDTS